MPGATAPTEHIVRLLTPQEHQSMGLSFVVVGDAIVVEDVDEGGPFSRAGVHKDDVITSFDGRPTHTRDDVLAAVGQIRQAGRSEFAVCVVPAEEARFAEDHGEGPPLQRVATSLTAENAHAATQRQQSRSGLQSSTRRRSAGAAAPSMTAARLRRPAMPLFEPVHAGRHAELLQQAKSAQLGSRIPKSFSFPADEAFWDNFVVQSKLSPEAQEEPLFEVQASHDSSVHQVSQAWMRAFVAGWELANPHVVTVSAGSAVRAFYASDEFWNEVVGDLEHAPVDNPEVYVSSNLHPDRQPVGTTVDKWNDACNRWEESRRCSPEHRKLVMQQRQEEVRTLEMRRAAERTLRRDSRLSRRTHGSSHGDSWGARGAPAPAPAPAPAASWQPPTPPEPSSQTDAEGQLSLRTLASRVEDLERENRKAHAELRRLRDGGAGAAGLPSTPAADALGLREWERRLSERERMLLAAEAQLLQSGLLTARSAPDPSPAPAPSPPVGALWRREAVTPPHPASPQPQPQPQPGAAPPRRPPQLPRGTSPRGVPRAPPPPAGARHLPRQLPSVSPPRPSHGTPEADWQQRAAPAAQPQQQQLAPPQQLSPQHQGALVTVPARQSTGSPPMRLLIEVLRDGQPAGSAAFDFNECWDVI